MEQPNSELKTSRFSPGDMPALGATGHYFIPTTALEMAHFIFGTPGLPHDIQGAVADSNLHLLNRS
ncbi:MAG: hypothetical protein O8C66_07170 [Candidatus Methanoperedens sp.]|nr:hypothetical protein [Candidatus Methanoperedens sp.]MCZ7370274.1 hypothetical protein [Candidatus Methanoperedens sp.]